jgi:hypothetical protein
MDDINQISIQISIQYIYIDYIDIYRLYRLYIDIYYI